jgi:hypothetical protein
MANPRAVEPAARLHPHVRWWVVVSWHTAALNNSPSLWCANRCPRTCSCAADSRTLSRSEESQLWDTAGQRDNKHARPCCSGAELHVLAADAPIFAHSPRPRRHTHTVPQLTFCMRRWRKSIPPATRMAQSCGWCSHGLMPGGWCSFQKTCWKMPARRWKLDSGRERESRRQDL